MCNVQIDKIVEGLTQVFPEGREFAVGLISEFNSLGLASAPEVVVNGGRDDELLERIMRASEQIRSTNFIFDYIRYPVDVVVMKENSKVTSALLVAVGGKSFTHAEADIGFENRVISYITDAIAEDGAEVSEVSGRLFF